MLLGWVLSNKPLSFFEIDTPLYIYIYIYMCVCVCVCVCVMDSSVKYQRIRPDSSVKDADH